MDQKTVVHLHSGKLLSRKKEEAPPFTTAWMECNKPGSERQIPYDLIYKWKLINKTNKQAKYNQRHGNKEQTDSNQRGIRGQRRRRYKGPMGNDNGRGGVVG